MDETRRQLVRYAAAILVVQLITPVSSAYPQAESISGFELGPQMDKITPKQFIIDPPTLENLGFRWYINGDSNRNASVAVAFRRKGQADRKKALPMLRVHHEVSNQKYGPYRTGNLFAGSVLFLEPATEYEVRLTMSDPDGGAPAEPKIVAVATRAEPTACEGGRTFKATPEKGLMAAGFEPDPTGWFCPILDTWKLGA